MWTEQRTFLSSFVKSIGAVIMKKVKRNFEDGRTNDKRDISIYKIAFGSLTGFSNVPIYFEIKDMDRTRLKSGQEIRCTPTSMTRFPLIAGLSQYVEH